MPNLDHEDSQEKSDTEHQLPVSMPSLDEDEQQSQTSQEEQQEGDQAIPMSSMTCKMLPMANRLNSFWMKTVRSCS